MATDIRSRTRTLAAVDHEVASRISAAATGVEKLDFKEAPLGADALSVRNAEDVHRIVDPLPPGNNPGVRTENATPIPPGTYPGNVAVLDDGTRISFRPDSKSGGATIDIKYPDGNDGEDPRVRPAEAASPRSRPCAGSHSGTRAGTESCGRS